MGPLRPLEFDDAVYVFLRVFLYIRERRKRRRTKCRWNASRRFFSFSLVSWYVCTTHNCSVKNMPRIQKPLLKYARHHRARLRTNTPPRARRDVAKERATRPSVFWGGVVFDLSRCLPFAGGLFTLPALQRRRLLPKKRFLPQQKKE